MLVEGYGDVVADFDKCERLIRETLSNSSRERFDLAARKIYRLPAKQKILLVKGKSQPELVLFLKRVDVALRKNFKGKNRPKFVSSDDNRSGKDLREVRSGRDVELKSGKSMTDANCGIETIAWAIECDRTRLSTIMKGGCVERRIGLASKGWDAADVKRSQMKTMRSLSKLFNECVKPNRTVRPRLEHFCICVAGGITNGEQIRKSFLQRNKMRTPLNLRLDWDLGVTPFYKAFPTSEVFRCLESGATATRAHLVIEGKKSKRTVKIYPNFKNAYLVPGTNKKIAAANWVENPCFQVWIE
jgi:hypothetical protein